MATQVLKVGVFDRILQLTDVDWIVIFDFEEYLTSHRSTSTDSSMIVCDFARKDRQKSSELNGAVLFQGRMHSTHQHNVSFESNHDCWCFQKRSDDGTGNKQKFICC